MLEVVQWDGLECVALRNSAVALLVTRSVGPRVISVGLADGPNILAALPDAQLACPDVGPWTFYGGHRLWVAPEVPARTYLPDDHPVAIEQSGRALSITQPADASGIQKSLRISLPEAAAPIVVVDHALLNHGRWPVECAAWAITQLPPDGTALIPQTQSRVDAAGVLPNRTLALWPYTDVTAPELLWGNRVIRLRGPLASGPLKLGWPNHDSWLGYAHGDVLFIKQARYAPGSAYYDQGSSSQVYANARFMELETLGPRTTLAPGATLTHREVWSLYPTRLADVSEAGVLSVLEGCNLAHTARYLEETSA
ncbi:MAG: hypothetical protein H0T53_13190 [Herpetosiphonaceae bacterium]|nr:hypothetical protein [Herpetosiphonaceae bacterium]